jgi:hypothetical protein
MRSTRTCATATRSGRAPSSAPPVDDAPAPLAARAVLAGLLTGAAVAATASVDGGYFPPAWGWSALAFLLAAASTLIVVDRVDVSRLDALFVGGLAAVVAWAGASVLWSESVPRSVLELERGIVYAAGAAAILLLVRSGGSPWIIGGVLGAAGGVAAYALATRLYPDRFGYDLETGYQLARPLGYWNALGILAALGIVLALAFAEVGRRAVRLAAAALLPVLATTLYFTFSRGALVALAAGLVVTLALHPRRLRLIAASATAGVPAAIAVALASGSEGLAREQAPLAVAAREGHRLAAAVVALAAVAAVLALGFEWLARRVVVSAVVRRAVGGALLATAAAAVLAVVVAAGGPFELVTRARDAFTAPLPATGGQLEGRLFSVSGNGRADYWRVALDAYREEPLLGTGAGTYEIHWTRDRPTAFDARDAHNLYLETLAEVGPVGLALLIATLATPFFALGAARRRPLVAGAAGAYAAYLTHAALDWDWELPAITLAGLACGAALLVAARRPEDERLLRGRHRALGLTAVGVAAAFAFVTYVGNSALAVSSDAATQGEYERAASEARRAARWAPWASDPWEAIGEAELVRGEELEARRSFRTAIEKDPGDWELWYGLARASDGPERAAALERARRMNPRSTELQAFER